MKKVIAVLIILFAAQSYGVYGRAQADRVIFNCTMEVGPLCYQWEENALAKLFGTTNAEKMEEQLTSLKKTWDEAFVDRIKEATREKSELEKALDAAHDRAAERLDRAAGKFKEVLEAIEK